MYTLQGSSQSALTLSNVAGIFYILIGGLGMSMVVSLLEYLTKTKRVAKKNKVSLLLDACLKASVHLYASIDQLYCRSVGLCLPIG